MSKLLLLWVLVSTQSFADDTWSTGDTWREVSFQGLLAIDALQTRKIAENPTQWHEQNNLLGIHPTVGAVNRYFIVGAVLHGAISYSLPEKYRSAFQYVLIGVEVGAIANNLSVGIGF